MSSMRAFRLVLAVVIAVLVLRAVPAYSSHEGVLISALAIDPLTPTTLYAGTPGGVFKSTDGGTSWSASGLVNISALAIDPLTPTTLYAGSSVLGGVFKSTDGGVSWNATGSLPGAVFVFDPLTPTTLYAGTVGASPDYLGDLYKSTDGGASWSPAGLFSTFVSDFCGPCGGVSALAITPLTILGVTVEFTSYYIDGWVYLALPSGVIQSTDGGANWNATGLTGVGAVLTLAIDPLTPTTRYAGTDGAVYKSSDGGTSWNATGLTGVGGVAALAIDPLTPTVLYAGTGTSGVYKSTDGAASWNATGLTGVGTVLTLAINPLIPTILYAGTGTSGVYKSTNSGVSWNPTGLITWSHISSVSLNPTSVLGGSPSTGTVTLNAAAPAGGAVVALGSSNTSVATVPTSVTVAAGVTSADFMVSTRPRNAAINVLIWGASGGDTTSAVLTVTQTATPVTLSSLSLNPTSVTGGTPSTGTVTLSEAAPAGGAVVTLSSSDTAVATVPTSVTVASGATSANFTASTSAVAASTTVTISGAYGGVARSAAVLTVIPATTLSSVSLNPTSVTAGSASSGTMTLSAVAPAGGAVLALSSSNTAVATVPTSATVAAGATSATFTVSTNSQTACASSVATISATYGGVTRSAGLTVTPVTDTVAIQQADYFASRHELRVAATSTGSTATLRAYVTSTGELIGTLKHYDGNRYSGQFTWPVNPQNITVRSSLCGSAKNAVRSR